MSRILYICHHHNTPSGGVRTIYHHVNHLTEAGFNASVVHFKPGFKIDWFPVNVPVTDASKGLDVKPDDWMVFPEGPISPLEAFSDTPSHKAVLCQNHFYIFDALPMEKKWSDYGIETVFVTSKEIKNYIHKVFGIEGIYIPCAIDHSLFSPNPAPPRLQIAYMPRKGSWNIQQVRGVLWHRRPDLRSIPWIPIENISENEVAGTLQQSAFFLSTSYREGFGLPPLEAMACGCIVVGFTGGGGNEYATKENGFWVKDEDTMGLAETLEKVLGDYQNNLKNPAWRDIRKKAMETARKYNFHRQKELLVGFWEETLK